MFGRRPDGRRVKAMDPVVQMTPYLMPQRVDAQVYLSKKLDYETLARYIAQKSAEGVKVTFMQLLIAAYVRGVSQVPEVNRFVMNKQVFNRTEITCAFTMLRDTQDGSIEETAVKIKFDPTDTIYDVARRVSAEIDANRPMESANAVLKLARAVLNIPGLPTVFVGLVKLLDRYGLLPKMLLDILPFHTGLFVTNMASIGMTNVYHHIYNFGNTSLFMSLGSLERELVMEKDGSVRRRRLLPIGITADERVCAGATYAKLFAVMMDCFKHPEILENPPEKVYFNDGCEFHEPKPTPKATGENVVSA